MLKRLSLKFFQIHRRRIVELDRHVTTFVGITDAGKSTLLRALRWVCLNQFDGPADEFISWGRDFAQVRLDFGRHKLTRRKGDTNSYKLDGKTFLAFGAGKVPDEVAALLAVDDVNFQQQLDAHFWFSETPGEVSRQLNSIVNLSAIDETLADISTRLTRARADARVAQDRLRAAREQRSELAWVPSVSDELEQLEQQERAINARGPALTRLRGLLADVSEHEGTAKNAGDAAEGLGIVLSSEQNAQEKRLRVKTLSRLLASVERAELVASTSLPDLPDATKLERLRARRERLADLLYRLQEWEALLCRSSQLCPTCGQPIP